MRGVLRGFLAVLGTSAGAVVLVTLLGGDRSPPGPPLDFEGGHFVVPTPMRSGEQYNFPVVVVNNSGEPARLIGALEYCAGACYSVRNLPVTIPPHGRNRVVVHIEARALGEFEEEVLFYTDRPSQPTLTLKVQGITLEADRDEAVADIAE